MQAVLTAMQGKYGGLMAAQSATFDGMLSNLRDWAGATLARTGKPLFDVLRTTTSKPDDVAQLACGDCGHCALHPQWRAANALGGFLDGMLTGINNMATALSSANISGQVDAIVASLGAGRGHDRLA